MARIPRLRSLRHGRFDRIRRSSKLLAFLTARAAALGSTATAKTFTTAAVQALGTLTATLQPTAAETVTIGAKVYKFVSSLVAANDVLIGANLAASLVNLAAAINGSAGSGTLYHAATVAHTDVSATSTATTVIAKAKLAGVAGNSIATTETCANAAWGAATLASGVTSDVLNSTANGFPLGEGPLVVTTNGTLPGGLAAGVEYYVKSKPDADKVTLTAGSRTGPVAVITSQGNGIHSLARGVSKEAIFGFLKHNPPAVVASATDIDQL